MITVYDFKSFIATAKVLKILNPTVFGKMNINEIVSEMIQLTNKYHTKQFTMFGTAGYMITRLVSDDCEEFIATLDCEILGDQIARKENSTLSVRQVFGDIIEQEKNRNQQNSNPYSTNMT